MIFPSLLPVAHQNYKTGVEEEYVILGNDALMKCKLPSFVADFVRVVGWEDSEGNSFMQSALNQG